MDRDLSGIRIRVNFYGRRYLGSIRVPEGVDRVSDVLNDGSHFLVLDDVHATQSAYSGDTVALNKRGIVFVQTMEEIIVGNDTLKVEGQFVGVEAEMEHDGLKIRGSVFIPSQVAEAGDVLNDHRDFLNMRDVEVTDTGETYPYLALCKSQVTAIRILAPDTLPVVIS